MNMLTAVNVDFLANLQAVATQMIPFLQLGY